MTWEEIESQINEGGFEDQAAIWASGTNKGKELTDNYSKVKIDSRTREIYDSLDNDLREVGIEKNGRKTYDAIKEEIVNLRDKNKQVDILQSKITELESKGVDEALTAQIDSLTNERNDFQNTINELKREAVDNRKLTSFDSALSGLEFKDDLPKDLLQLKIDSERSKFLAKSEYEGDELRIKNDNGEIWLNNEHRPIDAQTAVKDLFSAYLKTGEPKGVDPNIQGGAQGVSALSVNLDVATLKGKGLVSATKALEDAYIESGKGAELHTEAFMNDFINLKQKIEL